MEVAIDGGSAPPFGPGTDPAEEPDFVDPPGLCQAFPVVLPLSSKKVGPKDPRSARWIEARLRKEEEASAEWSFRRERGQAQLGREAVLVAGARKQAHQAERDTENHLLRTQQAEYEIEASAAERQRQGDQTVYTASIRLQEANLRLQEVEAECQQRVDEANGLLENEKAHTSTVEELLVKERERTEALRKNAEETAKLSKARLAARDADVMRAQDEAAGHVEAAKKAADERLQAVRERCEAEERELRNRLEAIRGVCDERVTLEKARRVHAEEDAEVRKRVAADRFSVDQDCMRRCINTVQDGWDQTIGRTLVREEKTESQVRAKVESASALSANAAALSQEAQRRQQAATESLGQAVHVLGHHHACRRQFTLAADDRLSGVVRGKLHESLPPIVDAYTPSPSLRALPPPRGGLLALHAPP